MKILFFISSLLPLSILIFIKLWDYQNPLNFLYDFKFYIYFCMPLLACFFFLVAYSVRSKVDKQSPQKFTEIKNQNFNFFIPISSYFIPFISSNFNTINDWLIVLFVVFLVGFIVIKTNLQYLNPILILFGNLYIAKIVDKEVFVLSKGDLLSTYQGGFNKITSNFYIVRSKNESKANST